MSMFTNLGEYYLPDVVPHAVEREPDADDGDVEEDLGGEAVHVAVLPSEEVDEDEGEGGGLEGADGEDELAGEVPQLREEGVEEEGEGQAEDGDAEADGVHVVLHHGLHVHLRRYNVVIEKSK